MDLFRPQALETRQSNWLGSVDLTNSSATWLLVLSCVAFVIAALVYFVVGQHSRTQSVKGQLLPSQGLLPIVAPKSGTLARILVQEGASVSKGQPLFEVSAERDSVALQSIGLGSTLEDELKKQKRLLEDDLIWVNSAHSSYAAAAKEEVEHLRRQFLLLDEQYALKQQQARSAMEILQRVRRLDGNMLSALQLQQYESAALSAEGEVKQLAQQRAEAKRGLDAAVRRQGAEPVDILERRNRIERALSDVAQSLAKNEAETAQIVRAPHAGVVSIISTHPGQPVGEATKVLAIIPGSTLQAELWVPSQAVGLLAHGGRVAMRYDAFPYREFGLQYGKVARISSSALAPEEIRVLSGIRVDSPAYRVIVDLDKQYVPRASQRLTLRPNMTIDADLLLESQPLYRLLLPSSYGASGSTEPDRQKRAL